MSALTELKVTSHVGRDLLAAAASFKTEAAAIWEYVVNSLQYVDEGVTPKIQVNLNSRNKTVEIRDNGRGMTDEGLRHYFQMHGENLDRIKGRPGRGKFGTGKSAAFGIGNLLRVDTCRDGIRNIIELHRDTVKMSSGEDIELKWIVRNEQTGLRNGTNIFIGEVFLTKLSTQPVIEYIERHLQIFRARMPEVAVNEHVCQYREPMVSNSYHFRPSQLQSQIIGNVELCVKVSTTPLQSAEQGISITAGLGNLVAIETAGLEHKEFGNYLFGEIDVPKLETRESPIEPYDTTRSLQLNPQHPVARELLPFIGSKLEEVRRKQVQELKEAQKTEEARRLANEAQRIAELLNEDFKSVMNKLQNIRSASARPGDLESNFGNTSPADNEEGVWVEGTKTQGDVNEPSSPANPNPQGNRENEVPNIEQSGIPRIDGQKAVDPVGGSSNKNRRPRGGFNVDFRHLGEDNDRSRFDRSTLTILINLDHPVVKNSLRTGSPEDIQFRRLAYEIAFTEYSVAWGYAKAEQDPDIPADDLLYEVRSTINRISTSAAALY